MQPDKSISTTGPHRFHMDGWISCAPFERLLHIEILEAANGRAVLRMPFHIEFAQGAGLMHGGALVGLADTAAVMAIKSVLPAQTHFATVTMAAEYQRPVRQGIVTARSSVAALTDREWEGRTQVFDDEAQPVLAFRATFKIARDARIRDISFGDATAKTGP
ncbi:MAG: PaaI family thioesterase [Desulfobacterales bacterium]|nr:PaaI family thioesterase [Desulfobacterales bacterium]